MSEAGNAAKNQAAARTNVPDALANRVAELKVSGHLMTLDTGIFCIFHAPGGITADDGSGLPGVRISLPPSRLGQPDGVRISTFRADGWLDFSDGAALVRVDQGPAQVLVTVYQSLAAAAETAPRLQVLRLTPDGVGPAHTRDVGAGAARAAVSGAPRPASSGIVAHIQRVGDVAGQFNDWIGTRGSGSWIEGFAISQPDGIAEQDLEYQAVLGRGWLSPWIEGGKFCGSRGMALPLLGLNVRLKGDAAKTHECTCFATFVDGSSVGPVPAGEACQADSLAALEAFQIVLRRRGAAAATALAPPAPIQAARPKVVARVQPARPKAAAPAAKPAAKRAKAPPPAAKPAAPSAKRAAARPAERATPPQRPAAPPRQRPLPRRPR
jgi:hypothetical protein